MPSDPNNPLSLSPGHPNPAESPPIPSFGMLQGGSMLRRMKTNFAECITAPPRGVPSWKFAAMFRSAYFERRFPTRPLLQSILGHVCVLTFLISLPPASIPLRVADDVETARAEHRLVYYTRADRLPPVSPLEPAPAPKPQSPRIRLRVALGSEQVVSRPPRPDNSRQTIVQPEAPDLKLPTEVEIPNMVAWKPLPPPPPTVSETRQSLAAIRVPRLPAPVVSISVPAPATVKLPPLPVPKAPLVELPAPPPAPAPVPPKLVISTTSVPSAPSVGLPNVPAPPRPSVTEAQLQVAQLRVPRLAAPFVPAPTPEAPQLTLPAVSAPAPPSAGLPVAPVPPRPSVFEVQQQLADLRVPQIPNLVAVGVAPAPPPVEIRIPLGNRSGEFAVSPNGEEIGAERSGRSGEGQSRGEAPPLPSLGPVADLRVPNLSIAGDRTELPPPPVPVVSEPQPPDPRSGPLPEVPATRQPQRDLRTLMARASRPSFPEMTRGRNVETLPEVFGDRRVYTVYINMPNLASGAGSWILRFVERDGEGAGDDEISSPVALKKVDPKYAPGAVREGVEGTVTLAAQILRSGKVSSVKVVHGLDPRLDLSAVQALTLWQFEPARKKGVPIDLEVLVQIPFRLPAF